jgi:hypothetical protein
MFKRVQTHPTTIGMSLFHQGFIKNLVVYALRELQISWNWLLSSLSLEENGSKQRATPEKKPITRKRDPKDFVKSQEDSPISKRTRSCKRKY